MTTQLHARAGVTIMDDSASIPRAMIIVWSWREGGQVADEEVWTVAGPRHGLDRVVCLDRLYSPEVERELYHRIQDLLRGGMAVAVFLHRRHGYTPVSLSYLQSAREAVGTELPLRCFLFGEGADAIYLARDARGLLGSSGSFSALGGEGGRWRSAVADAGEHLLEPTHFEHVWQVYRQAYGARLLELREDLFMALSPLLDSPAAAPGVLYEWLSRPDQRPLLLRLLSFTGRLRRGTNLERELRQYEEQQHRSLSFDDFADQLELTRGPDVAAHYRELREYILRQVLTRGSVVVFTDLRDRFDDLLAAVPGATYGS